MITKFNTIVSALCDPGEGKEPITGVRAGAQFTPGETGAAAGLRNLNAAFLISLCGPAHSLFERADKYLKEKQESSSWGQAATFYVLGRKMVTKEFLNCCRLDGGLAEKVRALSAWIREQRDFGEGGLEPDRVWQVFFPEGVGLLENKGKHIRSLRERRVIAIDRLNPHPIQDPAKELLFSANVLLTVPPAEQDISSLPLSAPVRDRIGRARGEPQLFWYDHPVLIGTPASKNEIVYGLRALNRAIAFEKKRNTVERNARVSCVLSVSVTHKGLREIAGSYLREILQQAEKMEHLRIFAFTEADTARMVKDIFVPAAKQWLGTDNTGLLGEIFGVDGEYGRHYSFLKAVAAFWQVFVAPAVRATFKIDLDQVFLQEQLVRETGLSALEHFTTPLWGAEGKDFQGRKVALGMLAGALVNQADSRNSLFVPDVVFPSGDITGSEWIFFSRLPQAVSTEAEMMARYGDSPLDGLHRVIQRVHVTGGTTGILVSHLRKHRPFTPTFVGRAEDQAYLLSMLAQGDEKPLRTLHKAGLIMRHDKGAFAEEAIQAAAVGKKVGDYIRILVFSSYARAIQDDIQAVKREIDPYTGCFVSSLPVTIVYLRFAFDVASFFHAGKPKKAVELAKLGIQRIGEALRETMEQKNAVRERFEREKAAWNLYYDLLDRAEQELKRGDPFAHDLRKKAHHLVQAGELVR